MGGGFQPSSMAQGRRDGRVAPCQLVYSPVVHLPPLHISPWGTHVRPSLHRRCPHPRERPRCAPPSTTSTTTQPASGRARRPPNVDLGWPNAAPRHPPRRIAADESHRRNVDRRAAVARRCLGAAPARRDQAAGERLAPVDDAGWVPVAPRGRGDSPSAAAVVGVEPRASSSTANGALMPPSPARSRAERSRSAPSGPAPPG